MSDEDEQQSSDRDDEMDGNEESMGDSSEEEIKEIPLKQLVAQNKNASKRARQQESDSNEDDD